MLRKNSQILYLPCTRYRNPGHKREQKRSLASQKYALANKAFHQIPTSIPKCAAAPLFPFLLYAIQGYVGGKFYLRLGPQIAAGIGITHYSRQYGAIRKSLQCAFHLANRPIGERTTAVKTSSPHSSRTLNCASKNRYWGSSNA